MLSESEARTLNEARDILGNLTEAVRRQIHNGTNDLTDAYGIGRVAEASDRAAQAIHNALSCASAYIDDAQATAALEVE
jgi:hypothetical protein